MKRLAYTAAAVLAGLLAGRSAAADEKPHINGDDPCHTHERAGWPLIVSKCAVPNYPPSYFGYYVGGGCGDCLPCCRMCCCKLLNHCRSREFDEGTYGWDYGGLPCLHPRIVLCWGAKYQGGYGAYSPVRGPEVPDPIAYRIPECKAKIHSCGEGFLCVDTTKQKEPPYKPEWKRP